MSSLFIKEMPLYVTMDDDRNTVEGSIILTTAHHSHHRRHYNDDELVRLALPPATNIIDASGLIIMPGMVNTHGHVAMTLFRRFCR